MLSEMVLCADTYEELEEGQVDGVNTRSGFNATTYGGRGARFLLSF